MGSRHENTSPALGRLVKCIAPGAVAAAWPSICLIWTIGQPELEDG